MGVHILNTKNWVSIANMPCGPSSTRVGPTLGMQQGVRNVGVRDHRAQGTGPRRLVRQAISHGLSLGDYHLWFVSGPWPIYILYETHQV